MGCVIDCAMIPRAIAQVGTGGCACVDGYYWEGKVPGCLQKDSVVYIVIIVVSAVFGLILLGVSAYFARRYYMRQLALVHNQQQEVAPEPSEWDMQHNEKLKQEIDLVE